MSNAALAFMSGLAGGALKGYTMRRDMERDDEEDAYRKEQRERQRSEDAREDKLRADIAAAAKPREVTGEVYQPAVDDNGLPMPANPTVGTYGAGDGQRYADQAGAQAAVTAANAPKAQYQRVADAYMANGDAARALQMQTGARQAELGDLQLDQAKEQARQRKFVTAIGEAYAKGGIDGIAEAATNGYNDGFKYTAKPGTGDGFSLIRHHPDGKTEELPFKSRSDFLKRTYAAIDPSKVIEWEDRDEQQAATQANNDRTYELHKAQYALAGQREARMAAAAERSAKAAEAAAAPKPETPDSTFDSKTAAEIAKAVAIDEAKNAGGVDGAGQPLTADQIAKRANDIVENMRRDHTNRFIASTVTRELRVAQGDPAAYANSYAKAAKVMPADQLAALGFKPPAMVGPPAPPANMARPAPAAAPGPAAPRAPSAEEVAAMEQQSVPTARTTPAPAAVPRIRMSEPRQAAAPAAAQAAPPASRTRMSAGRASSPAEQKKEAVALAESEMQQSEAELQQAQTAGDPRKIAAAAALLYQRRAELDRVKKS